MPALSTPSSPNVTDRDVARARRFLLGGYDAIDSKNRRKAPTGLLRSEDAELNQAERGKLISAGHDIRRNFTVAAWMMRRHLDYVTTFHHQSKTGHKVLDKDVEAFIKLSSKRENYDRAGRHSLQSATRLAEGLATLAGDSLVVRLSDGRVQWVEGDRIRDQVDLPQDVDRLNLVHGVKVDQAGAALAYAVCRRGAVGMLGSNTSFVFERMVPARNAYLHGYFDRFDQVRGVSPLASALNELRDTYEGFDLARARMKVAQMFGLVFYRESLGEDEEPSHRLSEDGDGYEVDFGKGPVKLELEPGDKAEFMANNSPSNEFQAFTGILIQVALKALDIPYSFFNESFTNYSGSRGAMLQYERAAETRRRAVKDLLDWQTSWRLGLAMLDGHFPGADLEQLVAGQQWHPRAVPWIDPLKERLADIQAIGAGMDTRTRVLREQGLDFDDVVDELAYEAERLRDAGLPLNLDQSNALITSLTTKEQPQNAPLDTAAE